jgi:GNAT superfamily N-acetyltransferase
MGSFAFRPLTLADLPLVHRWYHEPHAARWFGKDRTAQYVDEEYRPAIEGTVAIYAYIALHEGQAVGLVDWVRVGDHAWLQEAYGIEDPETANCDVLIGEPAAVHRGLGARLVRAFLADVVFRDPRVPSCVIDPETDNFIAIRAYEKAGFRFLRAVADDGDGGSVYLQEIGRDLPEPEAAPFDIRPAREEELAVAVAIDDDAGERYLELGLGPFPPDDHPFILAELARWRAAAREGTILFACAAGGEPVGLLVLRHVDGMPYLQQISVRRAWMRRGIGQALVTRAKRWAVRDGELWLTTYAGVSWNQPWYERLGFEVVPDASCGPELQTVLAEERGALPAPERRVAMVCRGKRYFTP